MWRKKGITKEGIPKKGKEEGLKKEYRKMEGNWNNRGEKVKWVM